MTTIEIATCIRVRLRYFENDPQINPPRYFTDGPYKGESCGKAYYKAGAWASGRFVYVSYVNYQGYAHLTKAEAVRYLEWLDAGNVGRHYEALAPRRETLEQ